ncbi:MAG: DUF6316 family protein [Pseudomonadales bacterium]
MSHRNNEDPKLWFRTDRIFRVNGYWFFHTREDIDVGPYNTEFEAMIESDLLKNTLRGNADVDSGTLIREFLFESKTVAEVDIHLGEGAYTDYVVRESATQLTLANVLKDSA